MAMAFLSKENCIVAENANNNLENIPAKLRTCADNFRNSINTESLNKLLESSEEKQKVSANLLKYCDSIEQLALTLEKLHQTVASLVLNSRRAIRTNYMEDNHD